MKLATFISVVFLAACLVLQPWDFKPSARAEFYSPGKAAASVPPFANRCITLQDPIHDGDISSGFGTRRHADESTPPHKGVDYAAKTGTSVSSAADGEVIQIGWNRTYGRFVKIRHGDGLTTWYAHLNRASYHLSPGTKVLRGELIGYVGRTGRVTGSNLHFEVRKNGTPLDPMKFLNDSSLIGRSNVHCTPNLI